MLYERNTNEIRTKYEQNNNPSTIKSTSKVHQKYNRNTTEIGIIFCELWTMNLGEGSGSYNKIIACKRKEHWVADRNLNASETQAKS